MKSVISELENHGFCLPDFKKSNLSLMQDLASPKSKLNRNGKRKAILLIDGLGYDTLARAASKDKKLSEFIERNSLDKVSTIFPSFTPSVIISLNSGKYVGEHGIVGDFFSKYSGAMVNPFRISWMPSSEELMGAAPRIMPRPAILEKLKQINKGFVYIMRDQVLEKEIKSDFASKVYDDIIPHTGNEDLFVGMERELGKKRGGFIYAYTDALDHFSHKYSKKGEESIRLVSRLFRDIMALEEKLKKSGTELYIFSDHGQVVLDKESQTYIHWNDKFMDFLEMPVFGNGRSFFMKIDDGKEKAFEDYFERRFSKNALLFDSKELIEAGIFGKGKVSEFAKYNLGDKTGIALENKTFKFGSYESEKYRSKNPYITANTGTHGGMTPEEMQIPLLKVG